MGLPYLLLKHKSGTFACFEGGAVRRCTGLNEVVHLQGMKVPVVNLDDAAGDKEAKRAADISKTIFGV